MNMDKKNIVMIVIWFMVFFGMVFFLISMIPIMNFNSILHIFWVSFAIFYIGASLYYLNNRILGGLK
jgi:hypothetical protein